MNSGVKDAGLIDNDSDGSRCIPLVIETGAADQEKENGGGVTSCFMAAGRERSLQEQSRVFSG